MAEQAGPGLLVEDLLVGDHNGIPRRNPADRVDEVAGRHERDAADRAAEISLDTLEAVVEDPDVVRADGDDDVDPCGP